MDERTEKLKELLSDEAFAKQILSAESAESVQAMLEEKGVSLTIEEIEKTGELLEHYAEGQDGELSEDDLEGVAGGVDLSSLGLPLAVVGTFGLALLGYKAIRRGW